jgi:hypothetical protein
MLREAEVGVPEPPEEQAAAEAEQEPFEDQADEDADGPRLVVIDDLDDSETAAG